MNHKPPSLRDTGSSVSTSYEPPSMVGSPSGLDEPLQYPSARRDESVVDDYHGVPVPDPYRWLEDPDSEETKEFVEEQLKITDSVLNECKSREKLRQKITELYNFSCHDALNRAAAKYFYFHNTGLQPLNVSNVQDGLDGQLEALLEDGTVISVKSKDAEYWAYGVSSSGSDWITIKVLQIKNNHKLPDTISWVKFSSISWTHDSKGFFYSRYPTPKDGDNLDAGTETDACLNHELYYHFLGDPQSEDILCWNDPDNPKHTHSASVTEDGQYVLLYTYENCDPVNKVYYCDLSTLLDGLESYKGKKNLLPFVKLVATFDASYQAVANDGSVFTFRTNKDAPKYKLVHVDLREPTSWTEVLKEDEKYVLQSAVAVNVDQIIVSYLHDVKYVLQLRHLKTGNLLHHLAFAIGTVTVIPPVRRKDNIIDIHFTSFLVPCVIYKYDLQGNNPKISMFKKTTKVPDFDKTQYAVKQVFVPSKDDTRIPMFVVFKKGISLDGSHICLLSAYGGFDFSNTPRFISSYIVIARHLDAIFCIANIRGGGEYGEEWHRAGSLAKKQNSFDDFASCAEYLITSGFTQPRKLCIEGRSNGGLLIGALINQRPDLFGCALAHVGVMDMLRFHNFTIGHTWTSDYGCSEKEEEFHWLFKYSPLHNVRRPWEQSPHQASQYPSIMLLTADHDDRVVPLHSWKFLATLQHNLCTSLADSPQTNPIICRLERKAGHGDSPQKMIDEAADRYSFMAMVLGAAWVD